MHDLEIREERRVLRWGGLAGIVGGIVMIVVFAVVAVFVGADPAETPGTVQRFPDIRAARTVENTLYLVVLVLWMVHLLALYRALRTTNLAAALFGSVLGIVGLAVLAAGALPHVATLPISDLYHAPGATTADQAALVLMWQATWAMFDALLGAGLLIGAVGLIAIGAGMLDAAAFGKRLGRMTQGLGGLGLATALIFLIVPPSPVAAVGVLGLVAFNLVAGRRMLILSRTS